MPATTTEPRPRQPSSLDFATKVEKLVLLALCTDKDGEILASVTALKRTLRRAAIDVHDFARLLRREGYSEAELRAAWRQGWKEAKLELHKQWREFAAADHDDPIKDEDPASG
jgi:hypothetical protein